MVIEKAKRLVEHNATCDPARLDHAPRARPQHRGAAFGQDPVGGVDSNAMHKRSASRRGPQRRGRRQSHHRRTALIETGSRMDE